MAGMPPSKGLNSLVEAEHIGPNETGDNINAKRAANYVWDGANWQRATAAAGGSASVVGIGPLGLNNVAFDSLTYTATSGTVDTYNYYAGGTGGSLVSTLTLTYTDSGHGTLVSAVRT